MKVSFVKFVIADNYVQAMFKKTNGLFDDDALFARKFVTTSYNHMGEEATKVAIEEWLTTNDVDITEGDGEETYNEVVVA